MVLWGQVHIRRQAYLVSTVLLGLEEGQCAVYTVRKSLKSWHSFAISSAACCVGVVGPVCLHIRRCSAMRCCCPDTQRCSNVLCHYYWAVMRCFCWSTAIWGVAHQVPSIECMVTRLSWKPVSHYKFELQKNLEAERLGPELHLFTKSQEIRRCKAKGGCYFIGNHMSGADVEG